LSSVTIDPINSARILFSVGSPMYIKVVVDGNGQIGYAGANIENPTDPNLDVYFDFGEMAIIHKHLDDRGIFVNTTRVDHFGFPLQLREQGLGGYDATVSVKVADQSSDHEYPRIIARLSVQPHSSHTTAISPFHILYTA